MIPKISLSSTIQRIVALLQGVPNGQQVNSLLHNAIKVQGGPGSGKTHYLVNQCGNKDLIVAMTGQVIKEIKHRLTNRAQAMSIERACAHWHSDIDTLWVDESA